MTDLHVIEATVPWQTPADGVRDALATRTLLDRQRGGSKEFVFGIAELPPWKSLPLHATRQPEVDYVVRGRALVRIGATDVELGERAAMYVPPGVPRAVRALGPEPLRYTYTFACECRGDTIAIERVDPTSAAATAPAPPTWMHWDDTEPWAPVEPSKGLRVRYKRVMDRARPAELIAGIGDIDPGTHYTRHFHDQAEIYYILGGEGIVYVGDSRVPVRAGSTLYIGGRVVHGADSLGREPLSIYYVYGCETVGRDVNWTPVEEIYAEARPS
jgi:mannose-6-phosphate isomerase-like protein (cupin superfamily)